MPEVLPKVNSSDARVVGRAVGGRWVNAGGTAIDLACHPDGRVSGIIRFASDGAAYKPYQLRGTVVVGPRGERGVVATLVGWPRPAAETVWFGALDDAAAALDTKLMFAGAPGGTDWASAAGGSVFRRHRAVVPAPDLHP